MTPTFFATPEEFRAWLEDNHETATELLVGFHKKGSGKPSITWPESVEEALCFGWIDSKHTKLDDHRTVLRFSPRKRGSGWARTNKVRIERLLRDGLMTEAGR